MNDPKLREAAIEHAVYNLAWGLQGLVCYADEPGLGHAREGAEMLRNGLREVLELLVPPAPPEEKP